MCVRACGWILFTDARRSSSTDSFTSDECGRVYQDRRTFRIAERRRGERRLPIAARCHRCHGGRRKWRHGLGLLRATVGSVSAKLAQLRRDPMRRQVQQLYAAQFGELVHGWPTAWNNFVSLWVVAYVLLRSQRQGCCARVSFSVAL